MRVVYATLPGDRAIANEDFVAADASTAVVLDGVTPMDRNDTGCRHGVAWYAQQVGSKLFELVSSGANGPRPLEECLGEAIALTRDLHVDSCDLAHPDSPAATVAVVRMNDAHLDYLVLSDSAVVLDLDTGAEPLAVTDNRAGEVSRRLRGRGVQPTAPVVRAHRNQPGGYWVAAERPEAAYEARSGSVDVATVRRVLVATDGATRLVDTFGLLDWAAALDALEVDGPDAWLARTRAAERADERRRARRAKVHDDATVVFFAPTADGSGADRSRTDGPAG